MNETRLTVWAGGERVEKETKCLVCGLAVLQLPLGTSGPLREYCQPDPGEKVSLCRRTIKSFREAAANLERVRGRNGGQFGAELHGMAESYFRESNRLREQPYPYGRVPAGKPGAGRFLPRNGVDLANEGAG